MESVDRDYVGTKLKYLIDISSEGFSMDEDDFEIIVSRGSTREKVITKDELIVDEQGNYYLTLDTEELGAGLYMLSVKAYVPDNDFDDGIRTEVTQFALVNIKSLKK